MSQEKTNAHGPQSNDDQDVRNAAHPNRASQDDASSDPFDPKNLRLPQDFASSVGVKRLLTTVPVRKPSKEWWIRTHPEEAFRLQTAVIELKEDRETYLCAPALWEDLATESTFSPRALITTINRQGTVFVWPIRLPGSDGRIDEWSRSALDAAERARQGWVKVAADMNLGAYAIWETSADLPDPIWPDTSFRDLIGVAFKDRRIDSLEHPVLRRLRGEI